MTMEGPAYKPVIDYSKCNVCSICFGACPAEIMPDLRIENASLRGKVYSTVARGGRLKIGEENGLPPCQQKCPLHQDVRGYLNLIAKGHFREALLLIRETNPLPAVCGYVCHQPCETSCFKGVVDKAPSIKLLKRFVANHCHQDLVPTQIKKTKKIKVTIIGSGPAGLSAATELVKNGYQVEIIESYREPGGMLAWAIPNFRLPGEILRRDIDYIKTMGVNIKTGVSFGADLSLSDLKKDKSEAVIIATGTMKSLDIAMENKNSVAGYFDCLPFLREFNNQAEIQIGEKVLVVGGGNAALDSARSAIRLGAEEVVILYRRSRAEMPVDGYELEETLNEGVKLKFLTAPLKIMTADGKITGLKCNKTKLVPTPESKRPKPVAIADSEFVIEADTIISAVGQTQKYDDVILGLGVEAKVKELAKANDETMLNNVAGVFVAGDFVNGASTVVEAMASGQRAAQAVDKYLTEKKYKIQPRVKTNSQDFSRGKIIIREQAENDLNTCKQSQYEQMTGLNYDAEQAIREAELCLTNTSCSDCDLCIYLCPDRSITRSLKTNQIELDYDLCKGCGICAFICPKGAITMTRME